MKQTFTFAKTPASVEELKALPESTLDTPFKTAALTLLALCRYKDDPEAAFAMLDALKGPEPLSPYEKQFLRERLAGKEYKPFSFFAGAAVDNDYTPAVPYVIEVEDNSYSYPEENWATLLLRSAGADSQRPIKLRKKPSTGEWFLNEIACLADIRTPKSSDPWA